MRFADHPWGPWSPSTAHLIPGSPTIVGAPFGPGGFIFHPACRDRAPGPLRAERPDAAARLLIPGCPVGGRAVRHRHPLRAEHHRRLHALRRRRRPRRVLERVGVEPLPASRCSRRTSSRAPRARRPPARRAPPGGPSGGRRASAGAPARGDWRAPTAMHQPLDRSLPHAPPLQGFTGSTRRARTPADSR